MSIDIICTIGPASSGTEVLAQLLEHGMTIARINLSHGDHLTHGEVVKNIRQASRETGRAVRILGDLQGPKIRLGEIAGGEAELIAGDRFLLHAEPVAGNSREASIDYPGLLRDVQPGDRVLINDGEVQLRVIRVAGDHLEAEVLVGGTIGSRKGVNLPGTPIRLPALTEKDRRDLRFLMLERVDMIACSFIRRAEHLEEIRSFAGVSRGHPPRFIAKLETMEGLRRFSAILRAADGIMVARGDLGVEVPYPWVPLLQKAIIRKCRRTGTYVITATQMLQSMTEHPVPTRAEVTDVFQAVLDGTDAVMLSAESATGEFPVESVETLRTVSSFAGRVAADEPFDLADMMELLSREYPMVRM